MLGACWAPTPSRDRQQWRTEGLGLTAAFGIAGRLDSDGLRIGGGIFRASRRSFAYRRRYRGRGRRNMGAARVRRLAARKKSDHSVGAVSDLMPLNSNVVLSGPENVFVLYCPSYLPRQQAPKEIARRDCLREQSNVFYRGVKEEVFLSASRPLFWRRVVFYMALEAGSGAAHLCGPPQYRELVSGAEHVAVPT